MARSKVYALPSHSNTKHATVTGQSKVIFHASKSQQTVSMGLSEGEKENSCNVRLACKQHMDIRFCLK